MLRRNLPPPSEPLELLLLPPGEAVEVALLALALGLLVLRGAARPRRLGHGSYELAFRDPALYAWLLGQSCRKCDRPLPPWRPLAAYENDGGRRRRPE